jgi:hypothetical protein
VSVSRLAGLAEMVRAQVGTCLRPTSTEAAPGGTQAVTCDIAASQVWVVDTMNTVVVVEGAEMSIGRGSREVTKDVVAVSVAARRAEEEEEEEDTHRGPCHPTLISGSGEVRSRTRNRSCRLKHEHLMRGAIMNGSGSRASNNAASGVSLGAIWTRPFEDFDTGVEQDDGPVSQCTTSPSEASRR